MLAHPGALALAHPGALMLAHPGALRGTDWHSLILAH
jgi:hypothetical protein